MTRVDTGHLGALEQTLLVPLVARALQSGCDDPIVDDPAAAGVLRRLDVDTSAIRCYSDAMVGCAIRAAVFDEYLRDVLDAHPDAAVVLAGEGLDTTFERNDNGRASWFELDYPDVIAIRRTCFAPHPRRHLIGGSVLDGGWIDDVVRLGGSHRVVQLAGVTMYWREDQVRRFFGLVHDRLAPATVILDTVSPLVRRLARHWEPTARLTPAEYRFGIWNPQRLDRYAPNWRVRESRRLFDQHPHRWSRRVRFWKHAFPPLRASYPLVCGELMDDESFGGG